MKKIKDNKEMIISILLGFTLVVSIYSTIKIIELEDEIGYLDRRLGNTMTSSDGDDLSNKLYDIEKELNDVRDDLKSQEWELRIHEHPKPYPPPTRR